MRQSAALGALAGLQLTASLALQLWVFRVVGAGPLTDAYVASQTVPLLIVAVLGTPIQAIWASRLATSSGDLVLWAAHQRCAHGQIVLTVGPIILLTVLTSKWWLPMLFGGLTDTGVHLAVSMTAVLCAAGWLNAHGLMTTAGLRASGRFVTVELISVTSTLLTFGAAVWVVPRWGVEGAAWLTFARAAICTAISFQLVGRPRPALLAACQDHTTWKQLRPLLASASLYKFSPLVDRYWGSRAPPGGLTLFGLAQLALSSLGQVVDRALCAPVVPVIARLAAQQENRQLFNVVRVCVLRVTCVSLVALAVLIAVRPLWAEVLGSTLRLPSGAADQLWWLCALLLGQMHVIAAGSLVTAAFIALGDTRTPARIGMLGFLVSVPVRSGAFLAYGLEGLAFATSVYYVGNQAVMTHLLKRSLIGRSA